MDAPDLTSRRFGPRRNLFPACARLLLHPLKVSYGQLFSSGPYDPPPSLFSTAISRRLPRFSLLPSSQTFYTRFRSGFSVPPSLRPILRRWPALRLRAAPFSLPFPFSSRALGQSSFSQFLPPERLSQMSLSELEEDACARSFSRSASLIAIVVTNLVTSPTVHDAVKE